MQTDVYLIKYDSEWHRLCNIEWQRGNLNDELERMEEEVVVSCLIRCPTICLQGLNSLSKDG